MREIKWTHSASNAHQKKSKNEFLPTQWWIIIQWHSLIKSNKINLPLKKWTNYCQTRRKSVVTVILVLKAWSSLIGHRRNWVWVWVRVLVLCRVHSRTTLSLMRAAEREVFGEIDERFSFMASASPCKVFGFSFLPV